MSVAQRKLVLWSLAGFAVFLAVLSTLLFTTDLGFLKPQAERWISERSGRDFGIDGTFSLRLGKTITVVAEDVRLANAGWASPPTMLEIGRVEARLRLWSLLEGPISIEVIDLDDAQLYLDRSETGEKNWTFANALPLKRGRERDTSDARGFRVKTIDVERVRVLYNSPERAEPLDMQINALKQSERGDQFFDFSMDAAVGGRQLSLAGKAGTWAAMLAGKDIAYDLEGRLDTLRVQSEGTIDHWPQPKRPSLRFVFAGPDIDDLTNMLGLSDDGEGDVNFEGSLLPSDEGPLILQAKGNIAETMIDATGRFSDLQSLNDVDIQASIKGTDIAHTLTLFGLQQGPQGPFSVDIDAQRQGSRLVIEKSEMIFGSAMFRMDGMLPNFPALSGGHLNVDIDGPNAEQFRALFGLPGSATGQFSLRAELYESDSGEDLIELDIDTSLLELHARASLEDQPEHLGSLIEFELQSNSLARIGEGFGTGKLPELPISATGAARVVSSGFEIVDQLAAKIGDVDVWVSGLISEAPGLRGSDVNIRLAGPDLHALADSLGMEFEVPAEPYDVSGRLHVRDDDFRFTNIAGKIGSSSIEVNGSLIAGRGFTGTRITFNSRGPALEKYVQAIDTFKVAPGPYTLSGAVAVETDRVVLDAIKLVRNRGKATLDLELGLPISRRNARFNLQAEGENIRHLVQNFAGFEPAAATFTIDSKGSLHDSRWSFDSDQFTIGDAQIAVQGVVDLRSNGKRSEFRLTGDIPHLANIGTFQGRRFRDQALTWNMHVVSGDGAIKALDVEATLDGSDLVGSLQLFPGDVPDLHIKARSSAFAIRPIFERPDEQPVTTNDTHEDRFIPDIALPVSMLRALNATIEIDVDDLSFGALHIRDLAANAHIQDGILDVPRLGFGAPSGRVDTKIRVEAIQDTAAVSVALVARDFALGILEMNQDLEMTGDLDIQVKSTGADLRTLAGNADGVFLGNMRGGRIANLSSLDRFYGGIVNQALGAINPFLVSEPATELECVVVPLEITDGQVKSTPYSLIATNSISIASQMVANLKTEEIELDIKTKARKGLGVSAGQILNPNIKVVGTLASPQLVVAATETLLGAGASAATGGLTFFARIARDRLLRSRDVCATTASQAAERFGERLPDLAVDPSQK